MDWIAAGFTLLATYLLADHRLVAIHLFAITCVLWIGWGFATETWSIAALNVVLLLFNLRTIYTWRQNG